MRGTSVPKNPKGEGMKKRVLLAAVMAVLISGALAGSENDPTDLAKVGFAIVQVAIRANLSIEVLDQRQTMLAEAIWGLFRGDYKELSESDKRILRDELAAHLEEFLKDDADIKNAYKKMHARDLDEKDNREAYIETLIRGFLRDS